MNQLIAEGDAVHTNAKKRASANGEQMALTLETEGLAMKQTAEDFAKVLSEGSVDKVYESGDVGQFKQNNYNAIGTHIEKLQEVLQSGNLSNQEAAQITDALNGLKNARINMYRSNNKEEMTRYLNEVTNSLQKSSKIL